MFFFKLVYNFIKKLICEFFLNKFIKDNLEGF